MSELHNIVIRIDDTVGSHRLLVDGLDISDAVLGFDYQARAGLVDELHLELAVFDSDIEGQAGVDVPAETRRALVALGWTPPTPAGGDEQ